MLEAVVLVDIELINQKVQVVLLLPQKVLYP
jgi:hypothetical protein